MWPQLKKLLTYAGGALGVVVIFAALLLGAFRMFAASLPGYKEDLQAWVAETLDLQVDYAGIDLRMGFAGPELAFFDAELLHEDSSEPFVVASQASVVVDPLALFIDRRLVPTRLVFDGIQITLQRLSDGSFAVAGAPQARTAPEMGTFELPEAQLGGELVAGEDAHPLGQLASGIEHPFADCARF